MGEHLGAPGLTTKHAPTLGKTTSKNGKNALQKKSIIKKHPPPGRGPKAELQRSAKKKTIIENPSQPADGKTAVKKKKKAYRSDGPQPKLTRQAYKNRGGPGQRGGSAASRKTTNLRREAKKTAH